MQGAGKTTLIRELYNLGAEWLPENLGVGERMPVFIVESTTARVPHGFSVELVTADGRIQMSRVPLTGDRWLDGLKGRRRSQLAAYLQVPATVLGADGTGVLLLPGFEVGNEDAWQTLMRQALTASAATVVVTDQTRLAHPAQQTITEHLRTRQLLGRRPILVISRCEGLDPESPRAESLRSATADAFELNSRDVSTNVIFSGTTEESRAIWRPALTAALRDSTRLGERARIAQIQQLREVVAESGGTVVDLFSDGLGEWLARYEDVDAQYRDQLEQFDRESSELRAKFHRVTKGLLDTQLAKSQPALTQQLREAQELGWDGILTRVKDFLKIDQVGRDERLRSELRQVWEESRQDPTIAYQNIVDQCVARVLGYPADRHATDSPGAIAPTTAHDASGLLEDAVASFGDLGKLGRDESAQVTVAAMRLLPVVAFDLMMYSMTAEGAALLSEGPASPPDVSAWTSALTTVALQRRQLLTALVGFVGLEVAADIQVDSLTGLATALHGAFNPVTAAGAAISTAAATAAGAAIVLVTAAVVLNYANRSDVARQRAAWTALASLRDQQLVALDTAVEDGLHEVRAVVAARLRLHYHVDSDHDRVWSLKKAVADFHEARLALLEACGEDFDYLG